MSDDPTNALHVARARVRVGDQLAIAVAHSDQLEKDYADHVEMARGERA